MISPAVQTAPVQGTSSQLHRTMGFRDLLLFYLVTGFTVRWIGNAAAAGPSAVVIWIGAGIVFYIPLMFTVLELSSRYPNEGGCYVWSKRAFGDFAGFMTGWTYWTCNLPYFPGLFYFTAASALFIGGASWQGATDSPAYYIGFSLAALALAAMLNVRGLGVGKWLHNLGAVGLWMPALFLMGLAALSWYRFGSATPFTAESLVPSTRLKDIVFWSTIAFSLSGLESGSMMGDEIRDPRRNIPRALLIAGTLIVLLYTLSTVAMLVALPQADILHLQGFMLSVQQAADRVGIVGITSVTALLITLGGLGQAGAWFAAAGRLPFVAGLDRFLPAAFGRVHPRYGSPHVSLLVQAGIAAIFIFLSQAGTTVRGAYDVLVSMSIIGYFIPYLFMFASMIKLQSEPAGPGVVRVPGGRPVATLLGGMGFCVTAATIVLALIPAENEPNKALAVTKVAGLTGLLVVAGAAVYAGGRRRQG
ncbi:MAG TPA: APC family permease [Gemmatimonadales bacterium]|nr:APC family permease [Gemmatimonadales bacterium]